MHKITPGVIEKLSEPQSSPVLSIYIPTHRHPTPPHMQEDQIRLKNALREARSLLETQGVDSRGIHANLQIAEELIEDMTFWQNTIEGLAIFINEQETQLYHSPIEFEESVSCDTGFDVAPLHMIHSQDVKFYVLALSMHGSKVYQGDAYGLRALTIDLPKSPEDALSIDEMFANSQTMRSHGGGTAPHGEGDSSEAGSHERLQYFRIIEKRLMEHDEFDQNAPLLLVATESEAGNFKSVTNLPHLLTDFVAGNYMESSIQDLFAVTWPVIRSQVIQKDETKLVERFGEYKGQYRASSNTNEIEEAAEQGRVDTLLVNYIDETNDSVSDVHTGPAPIIRTTAVETDTDRLKHLIDLVYSQGGKIIGLDFARMPEAAIAAALYRY